MLPGGRGDEFLGASGDGSAASLHTSASSPLSPPLTAAGAQAHFGDLLDGTLGDPCVEAFRRVRAAQLRGFRHANLYYNNNSGFFHPKRRKGRRLNGDHFICVAIALVVAMVLSFVAMTLIYGGLADAYVEEPEANFLGLDAWAGECAAHKNARWTSRIINVSLLIGFTLMGFAMTRRLFAHIPTRFQHLRKGHSTKWVLGMFLGAAIFCLSFFFLAERARTAKDDESSASSSDEDCGPTYSDWVLDLIDDWVWDHWLMSVVAAATQFPLTFNSLATFSANQHVVSTRIMLALIACRLRNWHLWAWVRWCIDNFWDQENLYLLRRTVAGLHGTYHAAFKHHLFYCKVLYRNGSAKLREELAPFRAGTLTGDKRQDSGPLREALEEKVRAHAVARRTAMAVSSVREQPTSPGVLWFLNFAAAAIAIIGISLTLYWDTIASSWEAFCEDPGWVILLPMAGVILVKQTFFFATLIHEKLSLLFVREDRTAFFIGMPLVWFDAPVFFFLYLFIALGFLWCALFAYTGMAYLGLYHHEDWNPIWNDYIFFPIIVVATSLANSSGVIEVAAMPVQLLSFYFASEEKALAQMLLILGIGASVEALGNAKKMEVILGLAIKMWKVPAYAQALKEITGDDDFPEKVNQAIKDAVTLVRPKLMQAQANKERAALPEELAQLVLAPNEFLVHHGFPDNQVDSLVWGRPEGFGIPMRRSALDGDDDEVEMR